MDASQVKQFQKSLEEKLRERKLETAYVDGGGGLQEGDILRVLLPMNDTNVKNVALLEVMVTHYTEDSDLLTLCTTILSEIGPGFEALKERIFDWNLNIPLGAFGIYRQEKQMYHKYTLPFPVDTAPEALAERAMDLLGLIYDALAVFYEDAMRIGGQPA